MTPKSSRQRRLKNTFLAMDALVKKCANKNTGRAKLPQFEFKHNGNIEAEENPDVYDVTLRVRGMKNRKEEPQNEHRFMIYLPINYPVDKPIVKWNSDIFHPNILGILDPNDSNFQELRQKFESEEAMTRSINQDPRWADLLGSYVCLDALKENWSPFIDLDALVIEIANMVRYQTYNLDSVLNKAAASWAREKEKLKDYFPLDHGLIEAAQQSLIRVVDITRAD